MAVTKRELEIIRLERMLFENELRDTIRELKLKEKLKLINNVEIVEEFLSKSKSNLNDYQQLVDDINVIKQLLLADRLSSSDEVLLNRALMESSKNTFVREILDSKSLNLDLYYVTYVVVGILPRYQLRFIKFLERSANRGISIRNERQSKIEYLSTQIHGVDVLIASVPSYSKYQNFVQGAPAMIKNYKVDSAKSYGRSIKDIYCVDSNGQLMESGFYYLLAVNGFKSLSDEEKNYLQVEIPQALSVLTKYSEIDDNLVFSCVPTLDFSLCSSSIRKDILHVCSDKKRRLAIALSNFDSVNELNSVGNVVKKAPVRRYSKKVKNSELLKRAQNLPDFRNREYV